MNLSKAIFCSLFSILFFINTILPINVTAMPSCFPGKTTLETQILTQTIKSNIENQERENLNTVLQSTGLILLTDKSKENYIATNKKYYSDFKYTPEFPGFFLFCKIIYTRLEITQLIEYIQRILNTEIRGELTWGQFFSERRSHHEEQNYHSAKSI